MQIEIDASSGFCFGVQHAIDKAEELLCKGEKLYCLGEIVHNREEVIRLSKMGMETITHDEAGEMNGKTILIRSHGEPPSTYFLLNKNRNKVTDATCPVVHKLQQRVKQSYRTMEQINGQLVIFGKGGHPEVIGLNGQCNNKAYIVNELSHLDKLDFNRPIELYSQTTMPLDQFSFIIKEIKKKAKNKLIIHDTVCRQVARRAPHLRNFASAHNVILFVSGKKSSNGKFLFGECKKQNPRSYFISSPVEIDPEWFKTEDNVGICGATSTPGWLMEKVKIYLNNTLNIGEI